MWCGFWAGPMMDRARGRGRVRSGPQISNICSWAMVPHLCCKWGIGKKQYPSRVVKKKPGDAKMTIKKQTAPIRS